MLRRWQSLLGGLAVGLLLLALPASARAQDRYRVRNLAWDLSRDANETWNAVQNAWNSSNLSDDNPDARQLYTSMRDFNRRARLFAQESRQPGRSVFLRNEARRLVNQAARIDDMMYDANAPDWILREWSEVGRSVQNLADMYSLPYEGNRALARTEYGDQDYYSRGYGENGGSFTWRGTVDGSDLIRIRGDQVSIQHLEAQPIRDSSFNFSTPLPRSNLPVFLTKLRGRGTVELVEAPSSANNFTATVRIDDPEGGADSYAFRLSW